MIFFMGAPEPAWLKRTTVPLFVSMTRLTRTKVMPRRMALPDGRPAPVAIDGGVFTHMRDHGCLPFDVPTYAALARRACQEIGGVVRVAALDLMCEPNILAKSGSTVERQQRLTIENALALHDLAPEVPWMLTLQGWERGDYLDHAEQYERAGIDLRREQLVGLGSVCRRQNTRMAERLVTDLVGMGLSMHLLGFKGTGLRRFADLLGDVDETELLPKRKDEGRVASYDTQAAFDGARWRNLLHPDCERRLRETGKGHRNCNYCLPFGLQERERCLSQLREARDAWGEPPAPKPVRSSRCNPAQLSLFPEAA